MSGPIIDLDTRHTCVFACLFGAYLHIGIHIHIHMHTRRYINGSSLEPSVSLGKEHRVLTI